jgi:hypothetical protein
MQRRHVQPFGKAPHHADPVIERHEVVQGDRPQFHLPTFRHPQPRLASGLPLRRRMLRQTAEQVPFVTRRHRSTKK